MPADHPVRAYNDEALLPARPESANCNPKEFVGRVESRPRMLPLEDGELPPQDQIFE
jgi:hypothetical protein